MHLDKQRLDLSWLDIIIYYQKPYSRYHKHPAGAIVVICDLRKLDIEAFC